MAIRQSVVQLFWWLPLSVKIKVLMIRTLRRFARGLKRRIYCIMPRSGVARSAFARSPEFFLQQESYGEKLAALSGGNAEDVTFALIYERMGADVLGHEQYKVACIKLDDMKQLDQDTCDGLGVEALVAKHPRAIGLLCDNIVELVLCLARRSNYLYMIEVGTCVQRGALSDLLRPLAGQPMFGCAVARGMASELVNCVKTDEEFANFKRHMPAYFDRPYSKNLNCVLMRSDLVIDYFPIAAGFEAGLHGCVAHINSKGFSVALCNHVWVDGECATENVNEAVKLLGKEDLSELYKTPRIKKEENSLSLLCAAMAPRPTYLIDMSGLQGVECGTSKFLLEFLSALPHSSLGSFHCVVLVSEEACGYFSLRGKFPDLVFIHQMGDVYYKASIRVGQPWGIKQCRQLASRAYFNYYYFMDAIVYDCKYLGQAEAVERAWQFIANYADGILSISQFTQNQIKKAFPACSGLPPKHCVARLSMSPSDHCLSELAEHAGARGECTNVLIVGNSHEHKNTAEVAGFLPGLLPLCQFRVLGLEAEAVAKNVECFRSGDLNDQAIDGLYKWADIVVYPSTYEGFGLPLFEGLAYGNCVFVRKSLLNKELLSRYEGPGSVVSYSNFEKLQALLRAYIEHRKLGEGWFVDEEKFLNERMKHDYNTMLQEVSDFVLESSSLDRDGIFHQRQEMLNLML